MRDGEAPQPARSGQAFEEGPGQTDAGQGVAAGIWRRSSPRSRSCSIPASVRAPPGRGRRPACSHRRTILSTGRADFSAAHRARKSTSEGFGEAPQAGYGAKAALGPLDPDLARSLGIDTEGEATPLANPPPTQVGPARLAQDSAEPGQARVPGGRERAESGAKGRTSPRSAGSPARPPRQKRWSRCCAKAGPNSRSGRGCRTGRRGRKNPKAGNGS